MTQDELNRKCKDTKRLVKIAIEHGMTQKDIAKKAGLKEKSGSLVSRWSTGKALATDRQMAYFIKEFGELLRRKVEHLFYGEIDNKLEFYKLNGEVIFKHSIRLSKVINRRPLKIAILRIIILKQLNTFHVIYQFRNGLDISSGLRDFSIGDLSHCDNEDANWMTYKVRNKLSFEDLIQELDKHALSLMNTDNLLMHSFPAGATEIRFTARQALLKQGFKSNDIIDLSAEK